MQKHKINILSTRNLPPDILQLAAEKDIEIDCISFIETKSIINGEIKDYINQLAAQNITAVFTSMNAVDAVADVVKGTPSWNVYCIGYATKHLVNEKLKATIKGEADDGAALAEEVIKNKEKEVYFFCGNRRRDELPTSLKTEGIHVHEITVYTTNLIQQKISKHYKAILFYSPSAVESFFSVNKAAPETVFLL